ncbi:MAG: hypothetical protein ACYDBJ_20510 [Aggregatilineales bacterium]
MEIEQKIDSHASVRDSSAPSARTYPVDVEHTGIRIALPAIMIAGGIALYALVATQLLILVPDIGTGVIGRQLITALGYQMPDLVFYPENAPILRDASGFIAFFLGLVGALLIGAIADRLLKRYWPSGRTLTIDGQTLQLKDTRHAPSEIVIALDRRINTAGWQFTVRRSSPRAQRGWHMVAYQFLQDDTQIIVYTFMSPKAFAVLPGADRFVELKTDPTPRTARQTANVQALRVSSEQRRLDAIEAKRLECGAELQPQDFVTVLSVVIPRSDRPRSASSSTSTPVASLHKD